MATAIKLIDVDVNNIYKYWRLYLLAHSDAKYFGSVFDMTKLATFPYANLRLIGRPTDGSDLANDEATIALTYEAEAYINDNKILTLYNIDKANAEYLQTLGFRRIGDSQVIKVSVTVTKITSRFVLPHYCGSFLNEPGSFR